MRSYRETQSAGLVLSYALNLWMIHWLGPALYVLPSHIGFDRQAVVRGLEVSTYGIVAFVLGSLLVAPALLSVLPRANHQTPDMRLPRAYVAVGVVSFFLTPVLRVIPSATALTSAGYKLVIVGLALLWWQAWRRSDRRQMNFWLAVCIGLPFLTMITMGFIGYGATATLAIVSFIAGRIRRNRPMAVALFVVLCYVGLSVFVTYMRDRDHIRSVVWGGESYGARVASVVDTFTDFEWFDASDPRHLEAIDSRLNQSLLVGLAASRLDGTNLFARGETIWDSLLALIPRAVWPEKPDRLSAGSGTLVAEFTGQRRYDSDLTSVGIGHVMELFVNFGTLGVVLGFLLMGAAISTVDELAARSLAADNVQDFALWFLGGLCLLQVGGSFVETTTSVVAALVVARFVNVYLTRTFATKRAEGSRVWQAQKRVRCPNGAVLTDQMQ